MNRIIFIEDKQEFAEGFVIEATSKNIEVAHKKSFAGLKELLPKFHTKFAAVVLDINCLMEDSSPKEESAFIGAAMKYLDQKVPNFPRFILTGEEREFENLRSFYKEEKIFLKTPSDITRLYDELKKCIDNSEILLSKRLYPEVFDCFENGLLPSSAEAQLRKILNEGLEESEFGNFKGIFANIRAFQETIFKTLNSRRKDAIPDSMFKPNGMVKFNDLMKHLNGHPNNSYVATRPVFQNSTINKTNEWIYWSCGEYIHDDPNRTYFVSRFTLRAMAYGLLELIVWSKQYT